MMMANKLPPTVRAYMSGSNISKRYIRVDELAEAYKIETSDAEQIAIAAGALYRLTRITLIHKERFDDFMKHIYKVPGTNKQVVKKFVRIGEGSVIYSIGHHRFIEMARAAGATYKINEGTGGTVLINLEVFDEYMEQFRQAPIPLKQPLFGQEKEGDNK
jgi:hypothetical protein